MNAIIRGPIACIECHGKPGKGSEFDFGIQGMEFGKKNVFRSDFSSENMRKYYVHAINL